MTKQKFRRYEFVTVVKQNGSKSSINGGFTGIISGSYSDKFGGIGVDTYEIYQLSGIETGNDKVVNCRAWFYDWQISKLLVQDAEHAAQLIETYNFDNTPYNAVEDEASEA